jgi:hypothetical protein
MSERVTSLAIAVALAAVLAQARFALSASGPSAQQQTRNARSPTFAARESPGAIVQGGPRPGEPAVAARKSPRAPAQGPKIIVVEEGRSFPITVQQIVQAGAPQEKKKAAEAAKEKVYVPARWVETEHGVLVLEHGRWVEAGSDRGSRQRER